MSISLGHVRGCHIGSLSNANRMIKSTSVYYQNPIIWPIIGKSFAGIVVLRVMLDFSTTSMKWHMIDILVDCVGGEKLE